MNEFWITNSTNKNISLSDLNLTIQAKSSCNLLDLKHYSYSKEQLIKSAKSGSLYKKKIIIRISSPKKKETNKYYNNKYVIVPSRTKSIFEIKEKNYEELQVSDEIFAAENADLIDEMNNLKIKKE